MLQAVLQEFIYFFLFEPACSFLFVFFSVNEFIQRRYNLRSDSFHIICRFSDAIMFPKKKLIFKYIIIKKKKSSSRFTVQGGCIFFEAVEVFIVCGVEGSYMLPDLRVFLCTIFLNLY